MPILTALACLAFACAPASWNPRRPDAPEPWEPARARPATPPPLPAPGPGSIAVTLDAVEGAESLDVGTGTGSIRLARRGDLVVASDGRRGPWLVVEGGPRGLDLEGRRYLGNLLVSARAAGGLAVRNHVDFEDYVRGVVAREIAIWSAPPALLEAQAIAARSYARAQLATSRQGRTRTFLSDSTQDQAYGGEYLPDGAAATQVAARLVDAVERTRAVVLTTTGRVLDARFHASCGGTTAAFEGVFPEPDPGGMSPVDCAPCRRQVAAVPASTSASGTTWEWTAKPEDLQRLAVALEIGTHITSVLPVRGDAHGRWLAVRVAGDAGRTNISATDLRRHLGWTHLKSAAITTMRPAAGQPIAGPLTFAGRGRGHGVGLCQTGARELAEQGWTSAQILSHYFPTATHARLVYR